MPAAELEVEDWVQRSDGQALKVVLLRGAAVGVDDSYLKRPILVAELRSRFRDASGQAAFPEHTLQMGYRPGLWPEPRRRIAEVMLA